MFVSVRVNVCPWVCLCVCVCVCVCGMFVCLRVRLCLHDCLCTHLLECVLCDNQHCVTGVLSFLFVKILFQIADMHIHALFELEASTLSG